MSEMLLERTLEISTFTAAHTTLDVVTVDDIEFVDITDRIRELVRSSRIRCGFVSIQTRHATTGIVINENEPLLISDMKCLLERLIPASAGYQHDNFTIRTVNLTPGERSNGHSHCRSLFIPSSENINVDEGELQLGRWQRIFLVELDGPRERLISVSILGNT